jgi:transposase-like protein
MKRQDGFLDMQDAARFLGVSENTLYKWCTPYGRKRTKIPVRKHGRLNRFWIDDLKLWSDRKNGILLV